MKNEKWTINIPLPSWGAIGTTLYALLAFFYISLIIVSTTGGLDAIYTPVAVQSNGDNLIIQTEVTYGYFLRLLQEDDSKEWTFAWTTGDLKYEDDDKITGAKFNKDLIKNLYSASSITILKIDQAPANEELSRVTIRVDLNSSSYERDLIRIDGEWFDETAVRPLEGSRDASLKGILEPLYRNKLCVDAFSLGKKIDG